MTRFSVQTALADVPRIDGAKILVVLENKFISEEIAAYLAGFPLLGAQVESSYLGSGTARISQRVPYSTAPSTQAMRSPGRREIASR
jgi:hypothetical protein